MFYLDFELHCIVFGCKVNRNVHELMDNVLAENKHIYIIKQLIIIENACFSNEIVTFYFA